MKWFSSYEEWIHLTWGIEVCGQLWSNLVLIGLINETIKQDRLYFQIEGYYGILGVWWLNFVALMVLLVALFPSVSIKSLSIESLGKISLTHSLCCDSQDIDWLKKTQWGLRIWLTSNLFRTIIILEEGDGTIRGQPLLFDLRPNTSSVRSTLKWEKNKYWCCVL
jgi:hypothetical protein